MSLTLIDRNDRDHEMNRSSLDLSQTRVIQRILTF